MLTKFKCGILFLVIFILLPVQVRAKEIVQTSEENVGQEKDENFEEFQQEVKSETEEEALNGDETDLPEAKDQADLNDDSQKDVDNEDIISWETTGKEVEISIVPNPNVETSGNKWKVIRKNKYVLDITITNNSSMDLEDIYLYGGISTKKDNVGALPHYYPQDGVTLKNYVGEGKYSDISNAVAVVSQLKMGESITLHAEVIIPGNEVDEARLGFSANLFYTDYLGHVEYSLLLVNEENTVQEKPTSASETKTAAKTGDDSLATIYLSAIAFSVLAIVLIKKLNKS